MLMPHRGNIAFAIISTAQTPAQVEIIVTARDGRGGGI